MSELAALWFPIEAGLWKIRELQYGPAEGAEANPRQVLYQNACATMLTAFFELSVMARCEVLDTLLAAGPGLACPAPFLTLMTDPEVCGHATSKYSDAQLWGTIEFDLIGMGVPYLDLGEQGSGGILPSSSVVALRVNGAHHDICAPESLRAGLAGLAVASFENAGNAEGFRMQPTARMPTMTALEGGDPLDLYLTTWAKVFVAAGIACGAGVLLAPAGGLVAVVLALNGSLFALDAAVLEVVKAFHDMNGGSRTTTTPVQVTAGDGDGPGPPTIPEGDITVTLNPDGPATISDPTLDDEVLGKRLLYVAPTE
jgi:hypothetical protein